MLFSLLTACLAPPMKSEADTAGLSDTGDSAAPGVLEVAFTTAYHSAAFFGAEPGDEVTLGTLSLASLDETPVAVDRVDVAFYVMAAPVVTDGTGFVYGSSSGWSAARLVESCRLTSWPSLVEYGTDEIGDGAGGDEEHIRVETVDFTIEGEYATALDVRCTFASDGFPGGDFGLAVDLKPDETPIVTDAQVEIAARNGTYSDDTFVAMVPQVAAVVTTE